MYEQIPEQFLSDDPFALSSGPIIYARHHRVNIFISDKPGAVQKLPNQQQLFVKISTQGNSDNIQMLFIQLTSDSELEFNFQFRCNDMQFRRIKQIQKLHIQFREYPEIVVRNFERLEGKNGVKNFQANFIIYSETEGKLDIIRKSEFKDDHIMEFNFSRSPQEHIRASIQYRYDNMRREYVDKLRRYEQYREIIRSKNPGLMIQIDKTLKGKK